MTARAGDDPKSSAPSCAGRCSLTQSLRSRLTQRCSIGRRALATDTDHEAAPTRELARETVLELIAKVGPLADLNLT